jgi:hypothetical protein
VSAAVLALLAEVIAGQGRVMERLDDMQEHIDESLIEERHRVETIARLLERHREERAEGLTVRPGCQVRTPPRWNRGTT